MGCTGDAVSDSAIGSNDGVGEGAISDFVGVQETNTVSKKSVVRILFCFIRDLQCRISQPTACASPAPQSAAERRQVQAHVGTPFARKRLSHLKWESLLNNKLYGNATKTLPELQTSASNTKTKPVAFSGTWKPTCPRSFSPGAISPSGGVPPDAADAIRSTSNF